MRMRTLKTARRRRAKRTALTRTRRALRRRMMMRTTKAARKRRAKRTALTRRKRALRRRKRTTTKATRR
jgi:hypothetical protein